MPLELVVSGWRGRTRPSNLLIQSQAFCLLNYPPLSQDLYDLFASSRYHRLAGRDDSSLAQEGLDARDLEMLA